MLGRGLFLLVLKMGSTSSMLYFLYWCIDLLVNSGVVILSTRYSLKGSELWKEVATIEGLSAEGPALCQPLSEGLETRWQAGKVRLSHFLREQQLSASLQCLMPPPSPGTSVSISSHLLVLGNREVQIWESLWGSRSRGKAPGTVWDERWVGCGCAWHLAQTGVSQITKAEMIRPGESRD